MPLDFTRPTQEKLHLRQHVQDVHIEHAGVLIEGEMRIEVG